MESSYLELHYYLVDGSHSMDASVRNKCEREALAVIHEIAKHLDISTLIESYAHQEGGLKDIWKAIGRNDKQLTLIVAVFAILFSCAPKDNEQLSSLEKEKKELEIEKLRLEIKALGNEVDPDGQVEWRAYEVAETLDKSGRVAVRRSNFYRNLVGYDKVYAVSFTPKARPESRSAETTVERSEFSTFVLHSDKLPPEVYEDAIVEIFAPVLIDANQQWKGFFNGDAISFAMMDHSFKADVAAKKVKFQHGTTIRCTLNVTRRYNELGEVVVTGYSVPTVLEVAEGGTSYVDTTEGIRRKRKPDPQQPPLF